MTISTTSNSITAQGDGANETWPFSFLIPDAASLKVYLTAIATGSAILLDPSFYSVSGLGNSSGGIVTYPLTGSPISIDYNLTVQRIVPLTQLTDLVNQGGIYPDVLEGALDKLTMEVQQLQNYINQTLVFPPGVTPELALLVQQIMAGSANAASAAASAAAALVSQMAAAASAALAQSALPVGAEIDWPVATPPSLWLVEYGQVISQTTYAALYTVLGASYNSGGEPAGTFRLPDFRGITSAGVDNMGGSAAGNLTALTMVPSGNVVGARGGAQVHTLTTPEIPAHTHVVTDPNHSHVVATAYHNAANGADFQAVGNAGGTSAPTTAVATGVTNQNAGGGGAHNTMQPTMLQYKIIYAGV